MAFNFADSLKSIFGGTTTNTKIPAPVVKNPVSPIVPNPTVPNILSSLAPKTATPSIPSFATPAPISSPILSGPPKPVYPPLTSQPAPTIPSYTPPVLPQVTPRTLSGMTLEEAMATQNANQNATGSSQNAPNSTNTPTSPVSPELTKAVDTANKAYADSLKISPEELSTQEDLDKLLESAKSGYLSASGQAIPMEFITGQLKAIEQRATALAEPLQTKLARLQATRTSSMESSKFALERADKAVADAKSENKPIAGTSFYDPVTGTFKQAPSVTSTSSSAGFTLSPGEKRFDANGKEIASGGTKPLTETQQAKADDAQTAKTTAKSQILSNISIVDEILKNPGSISGIIQTGSIPFTAGATTKNQYEQLKGLLALDKRQLLKGSGAISDFEAKTLDSAASDLGRNQSEKDFTASLKKIKGVFLTAVGQEAPVKVKNPNSGETIVTTASRDEINALIAEGNTVDYQ